MMSEKFQINKRINKKNFVFQIKMVSKNLPTEIWHLIFSYLPLSDLKTAMLVCKDFGRVGARESLWKDVILSRQKLNKFDVDDELAAIKMARFNSKQKIDFKDYIDDSVVDSEEAQVRNISRNILKYCCLKEHVRELSLEGANLMNMGTSLLRDCILKLETINFRYCKIAKDDLKTILSTIPRSQQLKSINLSSMDFSYIPPHMLQEAAQSLEKLHLNDTFLSIEQCKSLLNGIKDNPLLTSLGLGGQPSLKELPREMMMNMITQNLKCLELNVTNLEPQQMETIFKQISKLPTMTKLDLSRNVLTEVDKDILAEALSNIEDIGLMQTELSKDQVDALLGQILKKQKTKEANLYEMNLKDADKFLLAETVKTMEVVVLSFTSITYDQIITLLEAIKKGSKLRTLYLNQDQLSKVDTQLLCEAILTLEYVYLLNTGLARETVTELVSEGKLSVIGSINHSNRLFRYQI